MGRNAIGWSGVRFRVWVKAAEINGSQCNVPIKTAVLGHAYQLHWTSPFQMAFLWLLPFLITSAVPTGLGIHKSCHNLCLKVGYNGKMDFF